MTATEITALIEAQRFPATAEIPLQMALRELFLGKGLSFNSEVSLTPSERIDFMVGSIGIEVKVKGSLANVTRQLQRYAEHEWVTELILITTRAQHCRVLRHMNQKLVHVALLTPGLG